MLVKTTELWFAQYICRVERHILKDSSEGLQGLQNVFDLYDQSNNESSSVSKLRVFNIMLPL